MPLYVQTAPSVEPVDTPTAKRHWGIDHGEDDDRVALCVSAARAWCEHYTQRAFINRTYDLFLREWPAGRVIRLPMPPLSSVTSIVYTASGGSSLGSTLSSSDYSSDIYGCPGRVVLDDDAEWPSLDGDGELDEVRVRYVAGMASTAAALLAAKPNVIASVLVVGRDFWDRPEWIAEQGYKNEAAEALLWTERFFGEVDGLKVPVAA